MSGRSGHGSDWPDTNRGSNQADEQLEQEAPLSVAVLPFAYSGDDFADIAAELPTLLTAMLSSEPSLLMVERAEVDKALSEIELGLSGTVDPQSAAKVGFLIGAQVLVTGRAFPVHWPQRRSSPGRPMSS